MKPLRFGVQVAGAADGRRWRDRVRRVEAAGYDTLLMPDHLDNEWSPFTALATAAALTTTLRVGPLVLANDFRHPILVAREMATLDVVSEGRVECGVGAGWQRSDYDSLGLAYDRPGERIDRLREAVGVMKQAWSTGYATVEGEHYRVAAARGLPRPFSPTGPELMIGGGGKRILSLAAECADVVGINPTVPSGAVDQDSIASTSADAFDERIAWIREAAGDRFPEIDLQCMTLACRVTDDTAAEARRLSGLLQLPEAFVRDSPLMLVGSVDELCEVILHRRERYGLNYWVVRGPDIDAFAPVVERLSGS